VGVGVMIQLKKHIVSNVDINMKMNITKIAKPSNNYFLLQVTNSGIISIGKIL